MFGRKSQPRKGRKIDLSCPYCGHGQAEPTAAVSSYCRRCGEYFRIQKGVAVARSGVAVSGINPVERDEPEPAPEPESGEERDVFLEETALEAWLRSARGGRSRPVPLNEGETHQGNETGAAEDPENESAAPTDRKEAEKEATRESEFAGEDGEAGDPTRLGESAQSRDALGQGSIAALIRLAKPAREEEHAEFGADESRMPPNFVPPGRKRKRARDRIRVRCFRCNHLHSVTRYATSTQCERCSAYISLADYEIRGEHRSVLRTRGDVTVTRRGSVKSEELSCHDLHAGGPLDTRLDCSGDVLLRHDARLRGSVNCEHFLVDRKCRVDLEDGLHAEHVEISGTVAGNIACAGSVIVHRGGVVEGDVVARSIEVREGGVVNGTRTTDESVDPTVPLKEGLSSTMIE